MPIRPKSGVVRAIVDAMAARDALQMRVIDKLLSTVESQRRSLRKPQRRPGKPRRPLKKR